MRPAHKVVTVVLLVQVAWCTVAGVVLGVLYSRDFLFAFCGVALVILALTGALTLRWRRRDADRAALAETGLRVTALLVSSRALRTRVDNRRVQEHVFEARVTGHEIQVVARSVAHLAIGTPVTIAYDSVDPTRAVLVDDLERIATAGQPDWATLKRQQLDARFDERQ
jgi:hypothetical protein